MASVVICMVALLFLTLKFILPLAVMVFSGLGVEVPLPATFTKHHPTLALYAFLIGGPLLFMLIAACLARLVWPRAVAH